jgi:hypothetical protein
MHARLAPMKGEAARQASISCRYTVQQNWAYWRLQRPIARGHPLRNRNGSDARVRSASRGRCSSGTCLPGFGKHCGGKELKSSGFVRFDLESNAQRTDGRLVANEQGTNTPVRWNLGEKIGRL